jgi:regulator of sirC expression with transglutaminase-like and TPR domain
MPAALADYNDALRLSPNHAQYYYNRAATKASMNDLQGALADYNKFLEYRPEDNAAYTDRGMVRLGLTDTAGACQDWHKAASLGNEKAQELVQQVCR